MSNHFGDPVSSASTGQKPVAFASLVELDAGALLVGGDVLFSGRREQFVALASRHAVPASYMWRDFAEAGGLISYGVDNIAVFREVGSYAGRILKRSRDQSSPAPTR